MLKFLFAVVMVAGAVAHTTAAPITALYYTSSDESYVGGGDTVTITPAEGFEFYVFRNFDNGVGFYINDFATNPDFQQTQFWFVDFAAPFDAELTPGFYAGATRWPFQQPDQPGLSFGGNGRGNNTLTGFFEVFEAVFDQDGTVLKFAADFTQYDEGIEEWWNRGAIRFNSEIPLLASPVPEPASVLVLATGLMALAWTRWRRIARRQSAPARYT